VAKQLVNVEELLRSKAPKVYKFLPRFVINYVKRIVHEDDVNAILDAHQDLKGIEFANAALQDMGVLVSSDGLENIPKEGGYIFACNHPLGGQDGLAIISSIGKVRRDIKFSVNELLMALKNLDNVIMPVNIYGNSSRKMLQDLDAVFSSNIAVPIFPAGLVSRRQPDGSIRDLPWKKSFITQAKRYKKDVIPVWVEGKNSDFFYNFAKWRKKLGIKLNIEMFFLADEMFAQRGKQIIVHFGKPVPYSTFDNTYNDATWALKFQDEMYSKKGAVIREPLFAKTAAA
jgi:1-acyl-sn-glycerol-3-phosphate acyltransferase